MNDYFFVDKRFDELSVEELYAILRLRSAVFVVEQTCVYQELDGRDDEPLTRHLWFADRTDAPRPNIASYLRVLHDPEANRIGRVVTDPTARGAGLARRLVDIVVDTTTGPLVLDAQDYLEEFYASFGFVRSGPHFVEDGIPHVPMRLERN